MTMGSLKQMLSLVSPIEFQALQDICEYNDITEGQLICAPETITSIEMFMQGIPQICCLSFFQHLVSLSLIQQSIPYIEGLHNCPCLEILRLNENLIKRLDGLESCTRLRELYLHSNKIEHIKNISHLTDLEVLWLANNSIHEIGGLEHCVHLKELNVAQNPIKQVGEISKLKSLERLNAAATNIGSFKEVAKLSKLRLLRDLRFSDYQWGTSPISLLHNYQTYVLFRLSSLQLLDAECVSEESKQAANTIYTRKRVYYNMCIKSLKHRRSDILNQQAFKDLKPLYNMKRNFNQLYRSRKDKESNICKALASRSDSLDKKSASYLDYAETIKSLNDQLICIMKKIDDFREEMQASYSSEQESIDQQIRWLMAELDTGGNIRMEAGNIDQTWYKNCVELVCSRFSTQDYVQFGIVGISAHKVTRIHNRFLQDRFERQIESKVKKRHVDYLLYGESFQGKEELQHIIEEGFPYPPHKWPSEMNGHVLLSNSIGLADICRLQAMSDELRESSSINTHVRGWLIIAKAYIGVSVEDQDVGAEFAIITKASYPNADSVYRIHPSDPTQRSWYIFDSQLVVPEYLVEYEYIFKKDHSQSSIPWHTKGVSKQNSHVYSNSRFIKQLHLGAPCYLATSFQDSLPQMMKSKYQFSQSYSLDGYGRCYISGTSMLKRILPRDLSIITYLNLHNSNMSEVSSLKGLLNLRVLILSFNKLSQVGDGFKELTMLEVLDLSYNLFKRVDGLDYLKSLMTLDMSGNQLSSMNNLEHLLSQVPKLVHLNLRSNPVEELKDYKQQVFSLLPSLIELDCIPAMNTEAASIMHMEKCWSENSNIEAETTRKTLDLCNTMTQKGWKKDCKVHGGSSKNSLGFKIHLDNDPNGYAEEEVEEVCIEYRHLKSMLMFSNCSSLRKLSLPGNDIRVLEGLEHCTLLEELILEDNSINQVNQAVVLPTLWKLELGRNQLTSCVELGAFIGLTQLSIEKNNIISLKGLGALLSLMELYAAYNQLEDISEISNIRTLPKLMVLDLSGNQLCESSDYRSYSIFMLKKLKVLDGILVSDKELFDARERHMGRLTRDMLEEFLGRTNFSDMTVLDLSGKGIRHCGELFDHDDFAKLQELDLGYNFIACTHPFKSLKCLQKLVLQSNNIGNGPLLEDNSSVSFETYDSMESYPKDSNCSDESLPSTRVLNDFFSLQKLSNLNLDKNSISDIKSMKLQQSSPNLKLLSLKSNVITKIDGLSGLVFLEKLYLDNNCIKKIDPGSFENLPCLEELDLSNNSIRDVNHMEGLLSLRSLNLASNYLMPDRLGGFSCVKELSSLKKLQDLSLKENPVYRHPHYRSAIISILVQLQSLDGEVVTEEELAEAGMYMRREEKASEVWCGSEHDTFSPMVDSQSLLQTPTVTNLSGGKVALKITPFNFETMSIQVPMTVYSTYYQAPGNKSYDSWDAESMKKSIGTTYQSATSFSQSKQEGENRHPLGILSMRNFVRLNSKEKQAR